MATRAMGVLEKRALFTNGGGVTSACIRLLGMDVPQLTVDGSQLPARRTQAVSSMMAKMETMSTPVASSGTVDCPPGLSKMITEELVLYSMIPEEIARASCTSGTLPSQAGPCLCKCCWGVCLADAGMFKSLSAHHLGS